MTASLSDILTTQKNGVVAINGLNQTLKLIEADLPCLCTNLAALNVIMGDILTQLEQIATNTLIAVPQTNSPTYLASTTNLVVAGAGVLHSISIPIHGGSSQVSVYDSATTGGIAATNLIYKSLPSNAANFLSYEIITMPYTAGLVVVTDAGINAAVAYTPAA